MTNLELDKNNYDGPLGEYLKDLYASKLKMILDASNRVAISEFTKFEKILINAANDGKNACKIYLSYVRSEHDCSALKNLCNTHHLNINFTNFDDDPDKCAIISWDKFIPEGPIKR